MFKNKRGLFVFDVIISLCILLLCNTTYAQLSVKIEVTPNVKNVLVGSTQSITLTAIAQPMSPNVTFVWTPPESHLGQLKSGGKPFKVFYIPPDSLTEETAEAEITVTVISRTKQTATATEFLPLVKLIPSGPSVKKPSRKAITASALLGGLIGGGIAGGIVYFADNNDCENCGDSQDSPSSPTSAPPASCSEARLTSPQGTHNREQAQNFRVANEVMMAWEPSHCEMTIQSYQNGQLSRQYDNVGSGTTLELGDPGSEETEIKIWETGAGQPLDSIWVWIN